MVHDHLNMFQKVESHYSRKDSKKLYIADNYDFHKLTIMKMYHLQKEKWSADNIKPVGYDTYRKEFQKKNLAIYQPKKDQYKTCVAFQNKAPNDEGKKEQKKTSKEKNDVYNLTDKIKLESKRDPELEAITFDLEIVLYTPSSKVSTLFYKRKLCTYNLTTFNLANKAGQCYMWDETLAKRESNEIGSGLVKFCE